MESKSQIRVEVTIYAPVEKVWTYFTEPEYIMQWCFASPEWHAPSAENNLQAGGVFTTRMEAKDGSMGFDFGGTYDAIIKHELISYYLEDGRTVKVDFLSVGNKTKVIETFDPENQNPVEMQQAGWQAILDNFKKYTEAN